MMFDKLIPVNKIMVSHVLSVSPQMTMTEVVSLFKSNNVHHIPVVDQDRVVGMISASDYHRLEHHFSLFHSAQAEQSNIAIFSSLLAGEVMTKPVATIRATDTLQFAADIFRENLFHALPVVNDLKQCVGILTPYDLLVYAYSPESFSELT